MNGASSRVTVARHSYSVCSAACVSAESSDFQKRRRLRRTYQFESCSTNSSMGRAASAGSYASSASVTRRTVRCSSERTQRSSSCARALADRRCGVELRDVRVGDEERVRVPQRRDEAPRRLRHEVRGEAARVAGRRCRVEVPAQRVGAVLVEDRPTGRRRCRATSTSSARRRRGSGRGRSRCGRRCGSGTSSVRWSSVASACSV